MICLVILLLTKICYSQFHCASFGSSPQWWYEAQGPAGIHYDLVSLKGSVYLPICLNLPWLLVPPEPLLHDQQTLLHLQPFFWLFIWSPSNRSPVISREASSHLRVLSLIDFICPSYLTNITIFILSQNKMCSSLCSAPFILTFVDLLYC